MIYCAQTNYPASEKEHLDLLALLFSFLGTHAVDTGIRVGGFFGSNIAACVAVH